MAITLASRFSTITSPFRSRIRPRGAAYSNSRVRFSSASKAYASYETTWRNQRRAKRAANRLNAMITTVMLLMLARCSVKWAFPAPGHPVAPETEVTPQSPDGIRAPAPDSGGTGFQFFSLRYVDWQGRGPTPDPACHDRRGHRGRAQFRLLLAPAPISVGVAPAVTTAACCPAGDAYR